MSVTPDAVLTEIEDALGAIGEITGRTMRDDVTDRIFSRFCVGKQNKSTQVFRQNLRIFVYKILLYTIGSDDILQLGMIIFVVSAKNITIFK